MRIRIAPLALTLIATPCQDLSAQQIQVGLLGGVSISTGHMGERREPGWELGGVAMLEWSRWAVRADLTYSRYGGREADLVGAARYRDLSNVAVLANVLYLVPAERERPYLLLGAGTHRTQRIGDSRNVYGWVPGVQAGAGMRFPIGGAALFAEVRWGLIASDYGNGDFEPSTFVPISVGVLF